MKDKEPLTYPALVRWKFVAIRDTVKRGADIVARAKSSTFARRIANALNKYEPGTKGY